MLKSDPDDPIVELVTSTAKEIYGAPMEIISLVGGSEPNHAFIHYLDLQVVAADIKHLGLGTYMPDENLRLDFFHEGAIHFTRILKTFGV